MDCAAKGTINEEMKEDTQVNRLLTLAKENMAQTFQTRYEERYNIRNEELKKEYAEQYSAQIDELSSKIQQQDTTIENHKREINTIKDEVKVKDDKLDKILEEFKATEKGLEIIKTNELLLSKTVFEFYKAKTN